MKKKIYSETFCGEVIPSTSTHVRRSAVGAPLEFFTFAKKGTAEMVNEYKCLSLEYLRLVCPEHFVAARCTVPRGAQYVWEGDTPEDLDFFYKIVGSEVFCSSGLAVGEAPYLWQKSIYAVSHVLNKADLGIFKKLI